VDIVQQSATNVEISGRQGGAGQWCAGAFAPKPF